MSGEPFVRLDDDQKQNIELLLAQLAEDKKQQQAEPVKTIREYPLYNPTQPGGQTILLPQSAYILKTGKRGGLITLWVGCLKEEVDTVERTFIAFATGEAVAVPVNSLNFLDTIFEELNELHIFELLKV